MFINKVATKHNTAIVVDKDAFTISEPPKTFNQWRRQKTRHYSTARFYKKSHQFLLGVYAFTHFLFYPLFVLSLIFFDWRLGLGVFALRMMVQGFVWYKTMNRLNEKDLFPIFWLLDIWQFFYYIIFSFALVKKPRSTWK